MCQEVKAVYQLKTHSLWPSQESNITYTHASNHPTAATTITYSFVLLGLSQILAQPRRGRQQQADEGEGRGCSAPAAARQVLLPGMDSPHAALASPRLGRLVPLRTLAEVGAKLELVDAQVVCLGPRDVQRAIK